jgi:uncharacterized protein YacL
MVKRFLRAWILIACVVLSVATASGTAFAAACGSSSGAGYITADQLNLPTFGCEENDPIIKTVLQLVFGALAVLSLIFVVIGGMKYTLSGGDSNAVASAKKTILYAVIGLILGLSVFAITDLVVSRVGS